MLLLKFATYTGWSKLRYGCAAIYPAARPFIFFVDSRAAAKKDDSAQ